MNGKKINTSARSGADNSEVAPMSGIGNGHESIYTLERQIWMSDEPTIVKAIALAIMHYMNTKREYAWPEKKTIAKMCSVHENTVDRHLKSISKWIDIIQRKGTSNLYRARIKEISIELYDLLETKLPAQDGTFEEVEPTPTEVVTPTPTEGTGYPDTHPQRGVHPTPTEVVTPTPTEVVLTINRTINELSKSDAHERKRKYDEALGGTNPYKKRVELEIFRNRDTGEIFAVKEERKKLEGMLDGKIPIDTALALARGRINPEADGMYLANRVYSVLAELLIEHERKDKLAASLRRMPIAGTDGGARRFYDKAEKEKIDFYIEQFRRGRPSTNPERPELFAEAKRRFEVAG